MDKVAGGDGIVKYQKDKCGVGRPYRFVLLKKEKKNAGCHEVHATSSFRWLSDRDFPDSVEQALSILTEIAGLFDRDCHKKVYVIIFTPHRHRLASAAVQEQRFNFFELMQRRALYIKKHLISQGIPKSAFQSVRWVKVRWRGKHNHAQPISEIWFE